MTDDQLVKEIFTEISELAPEKRAEALAKHSGDPPEVLARVKALLNALDQEENEDQLLGYSSVGHVLFGDDPQPHTFSPGEQVGNRFQIIRLAGTGGMGEVYEAYDSVLKTRTALKTVRPQGVDPVEASKRFFREIRFAQRFRHRNLVRVHDVHVVHREEREVVFVSMEFLDGVTLTTRMKQCLIPQPEAIRIIRQVVTALAELHREQIIHRDLKPSNIMLVPEDNGEKAVVTDFGLANTYAPLSTEESVTVAGQVLGTAVYAAPEQMSGKKLGPEADIFALGVVMYEMLSGKRPFSGESFAELAAEKLTHAPEPPSRFVPLDSRWDTIILRCLEREPTVRIQNAQELLDLIDALERGEAIPLTRVLPEPDTDGTQPARRKSWKLAIWTAVGLVVLLVPIQLIYSQPGIRRELCRKWPGSPAFCELPSDKDIAVLPFAIEAKTDSDSVLAKGVARHIRDSFHRLAPHPEAMCVHLREDKAADGVALVLEGKVSASGETVHLDMTVRETGAPDGNPLVLRRIQASWDPSSGTELYSAPLAKLGRELNLEYSRREWDGWLKTAPTRHESMIAYLRGLGLLSAKRYQEAARSFEWVIDPTRDFSFVAAHVGLGDAYRLLFNQKHDDTYELRARNAYARALPLDREFGFGSARESLADLDVSAGKYSDAIGNYKEALQLWPWNLPVRRRLAVVYESVGRPEDAVATLREGIGKAPQCWLVHNSLASLYSRHGRFREAEEGFLELVRLSPRNASAFHNLAVDYIKVGRYDDAVKMASQSISITPHPLAYVTLGHGYLLRGCSKDALVNFRKAAAMDPEYQVIAANLADALAVLRAGSPEAMAASERAVLLNRRHIEVAPQDQMAYASLALNLARLGRRAEAKQLATQVLEVGVRAADVLLTAASAFEALGERAQALAVVYRVLVSGALNEVEMRPWLADLRKDPRYTEMLKKLHLNPARDPGGVSTRRASCPESDVPGRGWQ